MRPDETAEIVDHRSPQSTSHTLSRGEALLYRCMDAAVSERTLVASFAARFPDAMAECAEHGGIQSLLERWVSAGLVVRSDGKVLALAVNPAAASERMQRRAASLQASATHQDSGEARPRRLPVVGQGPIREAAQSDGKKTG
jgi:hypothetical protein